MLTIVRTSKKRQREDVEEQQIQHDRMDLDPRSQELKNKPKENSKQINFLTEHEINQARKLALERLNETLFTQLELDDILLDVDREWTSSGKPNPHHQNDTRSFLSSSVFTSTRASSLRNGIFSSKYPSIAHFLTPTRTRTFHQPSFSKDAIDSLFKSPVSNNNHPSHTSNSNKPLNSNHSHNLITKHVGSESLGLPATPLVFGEFLIQHASPDTELFLQQGSSTKIKSIKSSMSSLGAHETIKTLNEKDVMEVGYLFLEYFKNKPSIFTDFFHSIQKGILTVHKTCQKQKTSYNQQHLQVPSQVQKQLRDLMILLPHSHRQILQWLIHILATIISATPKIKRKLQLVVRFSALFGSIVSKHDDDQISTPTSNLMHAVSKLTNSMKKQNGTHDWANGFFEVLLLAHGVHSFVANPFDSFIWKVQGNILHEIKDRTAESIRNLSTKKKVTSKTLRKSHSVSHLLTTPTSRRNRKECHSNHHRISSNDSQHQFSRECTPRSSVAFGSRSNFVMIDHGQQYAHPDEGYGEDRERFSKRLKLN